MPAPPGTWPSRPHFLLWRPPCLQDKQKLSSGQGPASKADASDSRQEKVAGGLRAKGVPFLTHSH